MADKTYTTVASAAEELLGSIAEISRQVSEAAKVSSQASEETVRTNTMVEGWAKAADKIGEVVRLINDIASQTNLLALNATREIARNVQEASRGTQDVSANIVEISRVVEIAMVDSGQVLTASSDLAKNSATMRTEVSRFLDTVRAG